MTLFPLFPYLVLKFEYHCFVVLETGSGLITYLAFCALALYSTGAVTIIISVMRLGYPAPVPQRKAMLHSQLKKRITNGLSTVSG